MKENNSNNNTNIDTIKSLTKVYISEGVYGVEETGLLYIEPEYYKKLTQIDISDFLKQKKDFSKDGNGKAFDYIPYHKALDLLRFHCPCLYVDYTRNSEGGYVLLDVNKTPYLEVFLTNGLYKTLPQMVAITTASNRNIPVENIASSELRNNMARAAVKVIARDTGIGIQPFLQEDLEEYRIKQDLIEQVNSLYNQLDQKGVLIEIRDVSNMSVAQLNNHIQLLNKNLVEAAKRKVSIEKIIDLQSQLENKGVMLSDYPSLEKLSLEEITKYGKSLKEQLQKVK